MLSASTQFVPHREGLRRNLGGWRSRGVDDLGVVCAAREIEIALGAAQDCGWVRETLFRLRFMRQCERARVLNPCSLLSPLP